MTEPPPPPTALPRLPRLLVVDDTPDALYLLARLFEGRFDVVPAASGREALALAAADPDVALLLLDIVMPDMDGYEVLRRLRQDPATAAIPVAFLSALDSCEDQRLGHELGAVDYLTKPVDPVAVIARVEARVRESLRAQRLQALGERLSRHLSPVAWGQLFHGAGAATLAFERREQTLLVARSRLLDRDLVAREAFIERLDALAQARGGCAERFGRGELAALFDDPAAALRTALDLLADPVAPTLGLGLHRLAADLARFRGMGRWERTLLGQEAHAAAAACEGAAPGRVVASAAAWAALTDAAVELPRVLVTAKYEGESLGQAWLEPLPARPRQPIHPVSPGCDAAAAAA